MKSLAFIIIFINLAIVLSNSSKNNLKHILNKQIYPLRNLQSTPVRHILLGIDRYHATKTTISFYLYILHLFASDFVYHPFSFNYSLSNSTKTSEELSGNNNNLKRYFGNSTNSENNGNGTELSDVTDYSSDIQSDDEDGSLIRLLSEEGSHILGVYETIIDISNAGIENPNTFKIINNSIKDKNNNEVALPSYILNNINNITTLEGNLFNFADNDKELNIGIMNNTFIDTSSNSTNLILRADYIDDDFSEYDAVLNINKDNNVTGYNCTVNEKDEEVKHFYLNCECNKNSVSENLNFSMVNFTGKDDNKILFINLDENYEQKNNIKFRTSSSSLSPGAIVAIVASCIVVIVGITLAAAFLTNKKIIPKPDHVRNSNITDSSAEINNNN